MSDLLIFIMNPTIIMTLIISTISIVIILFMHFLSQKLTDNKNNQYTENVLKYFGVEMSLDDFFDLSHCEMQMYLSQIVNQVYLLWENIYDQLDSAVTELFDAKIINESEAIKLRWEYEKAKKIYLTHKNNNNILRIPFLLFGSKEIETEVICYRELNKDFIFQIFDELRIFNDMTEYFLTVVYKLHETEAEES